MLQSLARHFSPALVIACAALFVALGSAGYAATGGKFILGQPNDADATSALSSNVATGPSLSVTNSGGQQAAAFVTDAGTAPFSVNRSVRVSKLNADMIDGIDSVDLLQTTTAAGGDLTGTFGALQLGPDVVGNAELANDSVGSAEIQTDAVQATEIADNSIDGGEIVDNSLGQADLATGSVAGSELAANAVDSSKVANNSITTDDLAGTAVNGAVSYSAGSAAPGRCIQSILNVAGTQVGQVALIATNGNLQNGILLYAKRVASAGHLTIDLCNFSGTTMDAITSLPVRVVTFG